jgi:hypothetical protein
MCKKIERNKMKKWFFYKKNKIKILKKIRKIHKMINLKKEKNLMKT